MLQKVAAQIGECLFLSLLYSTNFLMHFFYRFQQYFKTTDANTRKDVAARYRAIAQATTSTSSGLPRYYCNDSAGECKDKYVVPSWKPKTSQMLT